MLPLIKEKIDEYRKAEWKTLLDYRWTLKDENYAQGLLYRIKTEGEGTKGYQTLCKTMNKIDGAKTLLDIGSAWGQQYDAMKMYCPHLSYVGVDLYPTFIKRCRARLPEVDFKLISLYQNLPFNDQEGEVFDIVTIRSLLDWYFPENGLKILNEAWRVTKKALIVKTRMRPKDNKEIIVHNRVTDKGYAVKWTQADWDKFLNGKNVEEIPISEKWLIWLIRK